jgi:hypothetical protein
MDECIISFSLFFIIFQFFINCVIFSSNMQSFCKIHLITFPLNFIHYTTLIPHFFVLDVEFFSKYFNHHQCWLAQLVAPSCLQVGPWMFIKQLGPTIWNQGAWLIGPSYLGEWLVHEAFPSWPIALDNLGQMVVHDGMDQWLLAQVTWTNGCPSYWP